MVYKDIISGAVLLALSIAYYRIGAALPASFLDTAVSSSAFPKMIGGAATALSALLLARGIWQLARPSTAEFMAHRGEDWHAHIKALGLLLIAISYLFVLQFFGYIVGVATLFFGVAVYNGVRAGRNLIAVTAGAVGFFWLFFVYLLGITMPAGSVWRALGIV